MALLSSLMLIATRSEQTDTGRKGFFDGRNGILIHHARMDNVSVSMLLSIGRA